MHIELTTSKLFLTVPLEFIALGASGETRHSVIGYVIT